MRLAGVLLALVLGTLAWSAAARADGPLGATAPAGQAPAATVTQAAASVTPATAPATQAAAPRARP